MATADNRNNRPDRLKMRPLSDLNVIDNFLFTELSMNEEVNEEFFRTLLSTFLQRDFGTIKVTAQKSFSAIDTDLHGIRVDAYIEELPEEGVMNATIYDIEAENRYADKKALPRRNRYYSGIIDTQSLASGTDYRNMKDLIILTILSYDPFGAGEMWYEAGTSLVSHPEISYEDGVRRIFLYAGGRVSPDVLAKAGIRDGERIRDMLNYICTSTKENIKNDDIGAVDHLVSRIKRRRDIGIRYMQSWEYEAIMKEEAQAEGRAAGLAEGRAEGREEGLAEGRAEGRAKGLEEGRAEGLEEGRAEGLEEGRAEGRADVLNVFQSLLSQGRAADLERAVTDESYLDVLLAEEKEA